MADITGAEWLELTHTLEQHPRAFSQPHLTLAQDVVQQFREETQTYETEQAARRQNGQPLQESPSSLRSLPLLNGELVDARIRLEEGTVPAIIFNSYQRIIRNRGAVPPMQILRRSIQNCTIDRSNHLVQQALSLCEGFLDGREDIISLMGPQGALENAVVSQTFKSVDKIVCFGMQTMKGERGLVGASEISVAAYASTLFVGRVAFEVFRLSGSRPSLYFHCPSWMKSDSDQQLRERALLKLGLSKEFEVCDDIPAIKQITPSAMVISLWPPFIVKTILSDLGTLPAAIICDTIDATANDFPDRVGEKLIEDPLTPIVQGTFISNYHPGIRLSAEVSLYIRDTDSQQLSSSS